MGSCVWSQGKDGREHKAQRAEVLAQEQEREVESGGSLRWVCFQGFETRGQMSSKAACEEVWKEGLVWTYCEMLYLLALPRQRCPICVPVWIHRRL